MKRVFGLLSISVALGIISTSVSSALAGSTHYYSADWPTNPVLQMDSVMPSPFGSATARSEIKSGRTQWNNVAGASVTMNVGADFNMANGIHVNNVPFGYVFVTDFPLAGLGYYACRADAYDIVAWLIELDPANNWHVNSSGSLGQGKYDLRSAATHEVGHAFGFKHIALSCSLWHEPNSAIMCAAHLSAPTQPSTAIYRTLTDHEKSDHAANY